MQQPFKPLSAPRLLVRRPPALCAERALMGRLKGLTASPWPSGAKVFYGEGRGGRIDPSSKDG